MSLLEACRFLTSVKMTKVIVCKNLCMVVEQIVTILFSIVCVSAEIWERITSMEVSQYLSTICLLYNHCKLCVRLHLSDRAYYTTRDYDDMFVQDICNFLVFICSMLTP